MPSPLLTSAQLAQARATAERTLTQTATRRRVTRVADGAGGFTTTTATTANIPCRVGVARLQRAEESAGLKLAGGVPWTVTVPAETDVRLDDELIVGTRTFAVMAVYAPTTFETARNCLCVEK